MFYLPASCGGSEQKNRCPDTDTISLVYIDALGLIDGVPFGKMRSFIREGYERNGVISITLYVNSPGVPGGNAWDTTHGTVSAILPG